MRRFPKLRGLVRRARELEAEGRALRNPDARRVRFTEAGQCRAKLEFMCGRITGDQYGARLCERPAV